MKDVNDRRAALERIAVRVIKLETDLFVHRVGPVDDDLVDVVLHTEIPVWGMGARGCDAVCW